MTKLYIVAQDEQGVLEILGDGGGTENKEEAKKFLDEPNNYCLYSITIEKEPI